MSLKQYFVLVSKIDISNMFSSICILNMITQHNYFFVAFLFLSCHFASYLLIKTSSILQCISQPLIGTFK